MIKPQKSLHNSINRTTDPRTRHCPQTHDNDAAPEPGLYLICNAPRVFTALCHHLWAKIVPCAQNSLHRDLLTKPARMRQERIGTRCKFRVAAF